MGSIDGFLAEIISVGSEDNRWNIKPLMIEYDGTNHPEVEAIAGDGLQPQIGDIVFVATMRNNLDLKTVNRFYGASESNCVILTIIKTTSEQNYIIKGNYTFEGNFTIKIGDPLLGTEIRFTEVSGVWPAQIGGLEIYVAGIKIHGALTHQHSSAIPGPPIAPTPLT